MLPVNSNIGALLDDPAIQLRLALELLKTRQFYSAWRLLARLRIESKISSQAEVMLLEAKALQLSGQTADAIMQLQQARTLFPLNPLTDGLLFELLLESPEAAPELARNQAWAILKKPATTANELITAVHLLQQLQVTPIGLCRFDGQRISGWLLNSNALSPLTVTIDGHDYSLQPFAPVPFLRQYGLGSEQDGFSLQVPAGEFSQIRIHLDGRDLAGSPIQLGEASNKTDVDATLAVEECAHPGQYVDVIVPVYKGYQQTRRCLESVLSANNHTHYRLLVIDDASPEPELKDYLEQLAAEQKISLLRQPFNGGFVKAVCRGMGASQSRDIILLNADTCVHGNWLDRLHAAAYSQADIGTVTPLSNNGELVSYPEPMHSSAMPDTELLKRLDDLCKARDVEAIVDIPVGVGFCLYITRACLDAAGGFDSRLIERGYCEDTDFCIRVSQAGWRNVCAANVFVAHEGSVSFGAEKAALVAQNVAKIYALYPEHSDQYDQFLLQDPLQAVRDYLQSQLLADVAGANAELLIMPAATTSDYRAQRITTDLHNSSRQLFYLHPEHDQSGQFRIALRSGNHQQPLHLHYRWPEDSQRLWQDLEQLNLKNIDLYDFSAWPIAVIQGIVDMQRPYRLLLNDYAAYCAQLNLTKPRQGFCGDPQDAAVCQACEKQHRSRWQMPDNLQNRRPLVSSMFKRASAIQLSSPDALARYQARFPDCRFELTSSLKPLAIASDNKTAALVDDAILRIAVLQADHPDNGYLRLLEMARLLAARQIAAELIVIGQSADDAALIATGKAWVTGKLPFEEIPAQLRRHGCQRVLHLAQWPQIDAWPLAIARQCRVPCAAPATGIFATALDPAQGDIALDPRQSTSAWLNTILHHDLAMTDPTSQP